MAVSSQPCLTSGRFLIEIPEASKNLLRRLHCPSMIQQYVVKRSGMRSISDIFQCYLCPGNKRAQGDTNPQYTEPFVFVNDYSAVKEEQAEYKAEGGPNGMSLLIRPI